MDLAGFDGTYLSLAFVLILMLALQNWLIKQRQAWLGVLVPGAYTGLLVYLGVTGRVMSLVDFIFSALGLLCLVAWWVSAREVRRQESEKDLRFVFAPLTAADFSNSFPPPPSTEVRRVFKSSRNNLAA